MSFDFQWDRIEILEENDFLRTNDSRQKFNDAVIIWLELFARRKN